MVPSTLALRGRSRATICGVPYVGEMQGAAGSGEAFAFKASLAAYSFGEAYVLVAAPKEHMALTDLVFGAWTSRE